MQSVRTLNSSLPSINQSKIALLTTGTAPGSDENAGHGGFAGRSNSNIVKAHAYNNDQD
jgi:hypothetical protein